MKKILSALMLALALCATSHAQTAEEATASDPVVTGSFWSNWYLQAGLDMTLLNPYGCDFSKVFPNGKMFGLNVAAGKNFTPEVGLRVRLKWGNGFPLFKNDHLTWLGPNNYPGENMDKGGYMAIYGDVQVNLVNLIKGYDAERRWSVIVFPRAGFISNLAIKSSSPLVGVGVGGTYKINKRLGLYADIAYQVTTSEFIDISESTTGMGVSTGSNGHIDIQIGVQWDLGKSAGKFKRLSEYK